MTARRGLRFVAVPMGWTEEMARRGLAAAHRALAYAAWDYCARERTDGVLTADELRRLAGHRPKLAADLVAADVLRPAGDRYEVTGYLDYNDTRAEIEAYLARQRAKAALGGRLTGAVRGSGGRYTEPGADPTAPGSGRSRVTESTTDHPYPDPYPDLDGEGTRDDLLWPGYGPEWTEFARAWRRRGLRMPPTEAQRRALWPLVDARPRDAATWLAEALPGPAAEAIGHVLDRFSALRGAVGAEVQAAEEAAASDRRREREDARRLFGGDES